MFLNKNTFGRKALSVMLAAAMISSVGVTTAVSAAAAKTTEVKSEATTNVVSSANQYGLAENIQDGNILHCFDWKYNDIKAELPNIAKAGFTAVQTSPAQPQDSSGAWYWLYLPLGFYVGSNDLGTKADLEALCTEADKYGVKVVVDVVANHLTGDHSRIQNDLKDSQYWHTHGSVSNWADRYQVINGEIGMPDLNTGHSYVQQVVSKYVSELKSVGVDGIRWDAAKHIGLPSEGDNFWSAVTKEGLYNYGEILVGPDDRQSGNEHLMVEYTKYISVTDSSYGSVLRDAFKNGSAPTAYGNWSARGVAANKLVYWAESHDTWSNGNDWGYSHGHSDNVIDRAYAVAGSRYGATALYFSRPASKDKESIKCGQKGSTHFTAAEVAAVNHFKNATVGQKEYYTTGSNCSVVCRQGGAVIVAGSGSNMNVSVPNGGGTTAPGTYKDEITGSEWTVTATTISGKIGSSGIAVIYDQKPQGPSASVTPGSTSYTTDTLSLTLKYANATSGQYSVDGGAFQNYTNGQTITIGQGAAYGTKTTVSVKASDGSTTSDVETYTYTKADPAATQKIFFDNSSYNWSKVYAYIYTGEGTSATEIAAWPGVQLTNKSATSGYLYYELPEGFESASVIWSDGTDTASKRYPADMQPGLAIGGSSKLFTSGNAWKDYTEVVTPIDPTNPNPTNPNPTNPNPTNPPVPSGSYVKGDATGDKKVGMKDCAVMQKSIIGAMELSSTGKLAADVDGDGEIGTTDVVIIMKYLVGFANTFGVGTVVSGPIDPTDPDDPTDPPTNPPVGNNTVYLNDAAIHSGTERYAIYVWKSESDNKWVDMTSAGANLYQANVPDGYTNITFCRMNGGTSDNSWTNVWNQTADLTFSSTQNLYTATGWGSENKFNGNWGSVGPIDPIDPTNPVDPPVGNNTVYLNDSAIHVGNERYAIYVWKSDSDNKWISMTSAGGNLYQANVPDGYTNIIFCRMNGGTSDNAWTNVWNQTPDLTFNSSQNLYTATGWGSNGQFNGNWSKK
ncbi:MAG: starch-binding protein [Acutalibacteraceae bacterium]|nr:starch-binding protein [Acutalibacteraceae bacterium]